MNTPVCRIDLVAGARSDIVKTGPLVTAMTRTAGIAPSWLGIPCITVRPNTGCPVSSEPGSNCLVKPDTAALDATLSSPYPTRAKLPGWDRRVAESIIAVLSGWWRARRLHA